jgi:acid phosphatase type 7
MSRIAVIACLILLAAPGAEGAFVKQPYLQSLTNSTVIVHWETSTSQTGKVEYGLTSSYGLEVSHSNSTVDHELTLTGLQMDTLYHYRAISGSDTSVDATFHSNVSANRPFRFFAFGDDRSDSASHQSVVNRMLAASPLPNLAVNVGDLTYDGSATAFRTFFNVEAGLMRRLPMYPTPGNHDVSNMTNWLRYFALPNNERWYTVRYGNSAFHCIDVYSTYTPGSSQYNWLVSELQADSANPDIQHIFVWFHDPPYTTNAGHSSNTTVRSYLCPLFERFHVAMAFQGHNHCYEHSLVNGVHYILTGGGGAPLYTSWNAAQPWTVYREATFEAVVVDVSGDTVKSVGIKPSGARFDSLLLVQHTAVVERPRSPVVSRLQATPNPFRDRVSFTLESTAPGPAQIEIRDALGRTIAVLSDQNPGAGKHVLVWDASDAPAGYYFCVARTASSTAFTTLVRTQ